MKFIKENLRILSLPFLLTCFGMFLFWGVNQVFAVGQLYVMPPNYNWSSSNYPDSFAIVKHSASQFNFALTDDTYRCLSPANGTSNCFGGINISAISSGTWTLYLVPISTGNTALADYSIDFTIDGSGNAVVSSQFQVNPTKISKVSPTNASTTNNNLNRISVDATIDCKTPQGQTECFLSPFFTVQFSAISSALGSATTTLVASSTLIASTTSSVTVASTTGQLAPGKWMLTAQIIDVQGITLDSTSTVFYVGGLTNYDLLQATSSAIYDQFLNSASTTLQNCSFNFGFSLTECLSGLFIPTSGALNSILSDYIDLVSGIPPIGYAKRFIVILYDQSTQTLPTLTFTIPSVDGLPNKGQTVDLTPWNNLLGTTSYLYTATSTITGHTIYNDFEPYWELFVKFLFGIAIVRLVFKIGGGSIGKQKSVGTANNTKPK